VIQTQVRSSPLEEQTGNHKAPVVAVDLRDQRPHREGRPYSVSYPEPMYPDALLRELHPSSTRNSHSATLSTSQTRRTPSSQPPRRIYPLQPLVVGEGLFHLYWGPRDAVKSVDNLPRCEPNRSARSDWRLAAPCPGMYDNTNANRSSILWEMGTHVRGAHFGIRWPREL